MMFMKSQAVMVVTVKITVLSIYAIWSKRNIPVLLSNFQSS